MFFSLVILTLSGCSLLDDLRGVFHGDSTPPGESGDSTLELHIDPAKNIRVTLDGTLVTRESPYSGKSLAAGEHQLLISAEGYHPFATPVTLEDGKPVELKVALRRKKPPPLPVRDRPSSLKASPPKPPPPPTPPGPPVPSGVDPISLKLASQPSQPVKLDGRAVAGKNMMLKRVSGRIEAGPLALRYRIGSSGLLEITVPDDGASWFRDGRPLAARTFPLHHGSIRLERKSTAGKLQIVWLRR
ncbi:MAG: PEGA domain-containing protein [Myxococcota bacterium]